METNTRLKKAAVKKVTAKKSAVATDPFVAAAHKTPVKKRAVKKPAAVAKAKRPVIEGSAGPVKKTVRTLAKTVAARVSAIATSPVKKRAAKAVKAENAAPKKGVGKSTKKASMDVTAAIAAATPKVELSPVFRALADVSLPELRRENRARLQMQTPTRLYFYWSVKENPWAMIRSVFGNDMGSYTLVLKLIDKKSGFEKLQPTDAEGNYWFDVEPNGSYEAEIGFYAPNRPYFRILHSNTVETPRRGPSPRAATDADWKVTAHKFAEVLDVAGFSRDAFDVVMAGDDAAAAESAAHRAFTSFVGTDVDYLGVTAEDIRYAMLALASGVKLEDLRFKISAALFAILQANEATIEPKKAMSALTENFDIEETEFIEEEYGPAVYGASLVNFPKTLRTRTVSNKSGQVDSFSSDYDYSPVSSHSIR